LHPSTQIASALAAEAFVLGMLNHTKEPKKKTSKPTRASRVFMIFSFLGEHRMAW